MFIGHFAVGFASKKIAPRVSLAWLILAPAFLDVLWPFFILAGWEKATIEPGITAVSPFNFVSYPISHSLVMSVVWSLAFGGVYYLFRKDARASVVLAFGVLSHWILDVISHRPDMPVGMNGPYIGLGLWSSHAATLSVEGSMFLVSVWIYGRVTKEKDRLGRILLYSIVALLLFFYGQSLFGPPPPSMDAVAIAGIAALAVFTPLFWWMDNHREVTTS